VGNCERFGFAFQRCAQGLTCMLVHLRASGQ
jgi:hypothetical protein